MARYRIVDQPFYDNVQLHRVGSEVEWDGPPGNSLVPADQARKSQTEAPVFPEATAGRNSTAHAAAARAVLGKEGGDKKTADKKTGATAGDKKKG